MYHKFANALLAAGIAALSSAATLAETFRLQTASITDIHEAFENGALSSETLVELCIARIEAYDQQGPSVNAVIQVNPRALEQARALDAERKVSGYRSSIHGIPVLLKDNYDTFDMPTTGASLALKNSMAPDDATTVAKLRAAGALILAKVNLSELARSGVTISSLMGQTLNPYDLTRTPGGSSGGTGAAIAASFGILGTGSDTGQSTRSPSSANSLVGIRPTYGLISRDGIIPISYTQDTAGPITRYVADAAKMMDAMVGFDPKDPATYAGLGQAPHTYTSFLNRKGLQGARIGYVEELFGNEAIHQEVNKVTHAAIADLRSAGATVFPVSLPEVAEVYENLSEISVSSFESAAFMERYFDSLGPNAIFSDLASYLAGGSIHPPILRSLKEDLAMVDPMQSAEYHDRLVKQVEFRDYLIAEMDKYKADAFFFPHQRRLVVPATNNPEQLERNGFMASRTGLPAITFPGGFSTPDENAPLGVPVGIEFLGRPFSEGRLIELAYAYEKQFPHRLPPASTPDLEGEILKY